MIPAVGGGLTNSGSMPISGGDAGPSTASSGNYSGQTIGAINMGSQGISLGYLALWCLPLVIGC